MTNFGHRLEPKNDFEPFEGKEIEQAIQQRFEKMAARFGNRVAINDPERAVTYEALNNAANNIARTILRRVGPASGQVAFVLDNDARAIQALLGILKSGRAYVPLDPLFPKDRLAYMCSCGETKAVITDHAHRDFAREIAGPETPLLLLEEIDLAASTANPEVPTDPLSMAYILFTSGSTGKPKGIAFAHRNLLHTTMCLINSLHITPEDRLTQLHSTSFAASVVDIYCSLLAGASVFPWEVKTRGTGGLAEWLTQEEITSVQWIPTPLRHMLESLDPGRYFSSVRLLIMASEPLTRREFELYQRHFPDRCFLVNQMGTSESYNYYLFFANKETTFEGSVVPAGYPVSEDREVLLLDETRKPVAPGEVGEIAIRSRYMSLGYWQNPEQTAKVFLPDGADPESKIYLTGDLGRRREDGCLIHLGRKDFQVKIRGYRIELPEVELAIKKLDSIRDVAVMARHDHKDELKLVAYYIVKDGMDPNVTELRRQLLDKLPDYMIPNLFIRVQEFPMTPSGKLDKNSLPSPAGIRPVLENSLVTARNATERVLVEVWRDVLGQKEVGVTDNFFELGGDSLQAAQVLHLIHERCGVDLDYSALIQAPQINDLAMLVEKLRLDSRSRIVGAGDEEQSGGGKEGLVRGMFNRLLQVIALYAPGLMSLRPLLHRMRGVHIGRDVAIGTSAIIETAHPELVWIGDNVAIGIRNVIIGHFSDSIDGNRKTRGPTVTICDNVYVGANVTILPNVKIGEGAVVTAGSVVNKSVPPLTMVQGNPAVAIAKCGIPLMGNTYAAFLKQLRIIKSE